MLVEFEHSSSSATPEPNSRPLSGSARATRKHESNSTALTRTSTSCNTMTGTNYSRAAPQSRRSSMALNSHSRNSWGNLWSRGSGTTSSGPDISTDTLHSLCPISTESIYAQAPNEFLMRHVDPGEPESGSSSTPMMSRRYLTNMATQYFAILRRTTCRYLTLFWRAEIASSWSWPSTRNGSSQTANVSSYLRTWQRETSELNSFALLAAEWDGILDFVAGQSQLDVDARAELINAALSGTAEGQQYDLEAEARTLLAQVVETSGAFTDPAALGSAKVKVSIVARAGLVFADLGQLSPAVRNAAIEARGVRDHFGEYARHHWE